MIFIGFIVPVLDNGDVAWSNWTKESDLLESVPIDSDRIIIGLK